MGDETNLKILVALEALTTEFRGLREAMKGLREDMRGMQEELRTNVNAAGELEEIRKTAREKKARQRAATKAPDSLPPAESRDSAGTVPQSETPSSGERVSRDIPGTGAAGFASRATTNEPASREGPETSTGGSDCPGTKSTQPSRDNPGTSQVLEALVVRDLDQEQETTKNLQRPVTVPGQPGPEAPPARKPDEVLPAGASPKTPPERGKLIPAKATTPVWKAYAAAYEKRYGAPPKTNARNNSLLAQVISRIGAEEAPAVAEFYVTHSLAKFVQNIHPLDMFLANCEALRTQWVTNKRVTSTSAHRQDKTQENVDGWFEAAASATTPLPPARS